MQTQFTRKIKAAIFFFALFAVIFANPAIVSRITTFTDGSILTAAQLNSEFNNIINTVNNLDDDNLSDTANISPDKISAVIAGAGISRDSGTGALAVNPDGVGLEVSGDTVQLKDGGITFAKLANLSALSVVGNGTNSSAVPSALAASVDGYVLRRAGTAVAFGTIVTAGIEDGTILAGDLASNSVTNAKMDDNSVDTAEIIDAAVTQAKRSTAVAALSGNLSSSFTTSYQVMGTTTITATGNRPVILGLTGNSSGSCQITLGDTDTDLSNVGVFKWTKAGGATTIIETSFGDFITSPPLGTFARTMYLGCGIVTTYDVPTAGSVTYSLWMKRGSTTDSGSMLGKVWAAEL